VVVDPNVFVSARISPGGTPAHVLEAAEDGLYELVASEHLLDEVGDVLARQKFRRYLPEDAVPEYLERLRSVVTLVGEAEDDAGYTGDPDDDYLVALALVSEANLIVSGDKHLLELEGESIPRVVRPAEFLSSLGAG
jgi:uncharacterized protein